MLDSRYVASSLLAPTDALLEGILAQLAELDPATPKTTMPATLNLLVTGSVPAGSGLSSSAAMTTASVIVSLFATGRLDQVRRREITNCAIVSERWVGVNSGGMDQSASVRLCCLATGLTACRCSRSPTRCCT